MKRILLMLTCVACVACLTAAGAQTRKSRAKNVVKQTAKARPTNGAGVKTAAGSRKAQLPNDTIVVNGVAFEMVHVAGGTFTMGLVPERDGNPADNDPITKNQFIAPAHRVTLSDYCIGKTEVTQALWNAVMGKPNFDLESTNEYITNMGEAPIMVGDNLPKNYVSWGQCQKFIEKLNALTGKKFRFPTEAEWEYAARGGNKSKGYKFSGSNDINEVAWYYANSGKELHPVGTKAPNELGIYDMTGNVKEWCADLRGDYSLKPQTNPLCTEGNSRVVRGGYWGAFSVFCRNSVRGGEYTDYQTSNVGLRLAY